jgi:aspartyl aminopeptidase
MDYLVGKICGVI